MTVDRWLENAVADAERRGLPELRALLETLAQATRVLRSASLGEHADGSRSAETVTESGPESDTHSR